MDTIHLALSGESFNEDDLRRIPKTLRNLNQGIGSNGSPWASGSLENLKVYLSRDRVNVKGSFHKYLFGNNLGTMTRGTTEEAVEKLGDCLNLPIKRAKVSRVDYAQNIEVDHLPEAYLHYLGLKRGFARLPQPNSLYYSNSTKQLAFYNKISESRRKRVEIPRIFDGKNILRYELRYKGRLPNHFNRSEVLVSDLFNEEFYMDILKSWEMEYMDIKKHRTIVPNCQAIRTPKDFQKFLQAVAIDFLGQEETYAMVERMRLENALARSEYYSRIKNDIGKLLDSDLHSEGSELVLELDEKVRNVTRLYR